MKRRQGEKKMEKNGMNEENIEPKDEVKDSASEFSDVSENKDTDESEVLEKKDDEKKEACDDKEKLMQELGEWKDKYIRLAAEFDNYRKRTLNEKIEMTKTASKDVLEKLLPVIDDFDRAIQAMNDNLEQQVMREGILLIYNKFKNIMGQSGVKEIESLHQEFNTDLHEAITKIPAPEEDKKGKVVDVVQKGYYLHDKVLRYSKVVVGE